MKKHAFLLSILVMISCSHVSNKPTETASPAGVDGWWSGVPMSISEEFQDVRFTYNFRSDGNTLTGYGNSGLAQPMIPIRDGKIEGDQITFWAETDMGEDKLRADWKGDVKDYDIDLICTATMPDPKGNLKEMSMV